VSSAARVPSTKMFMWRRMAGVESTMRSPMPGQSASSVATISRTLAAATVSRRGAPGNR
jgi:hypothetical protein